MTQITENDVMLNDKQNNIPLPKKITQITENDVTLKNEKNDVPLPKKMTRITKNDVMLINEKKWCSFALKNDTNHRKWRYAK